MNAHELADRLRDCPPGSEVLIHIGRGFLVQVLDFQNDQDGKPVITADNKVVSHWMSEADAEKVKAAKEAMNEEQPKPLQWCPDGVNVAKDIVVITNGDGVFTIAPRSEGIPKGWRLATTADSERLMESRQYHADRQGAVSESASDEERADAVARKDER